MFFCQKNTIYSAFLVVLTLFCVKIKMNICSFRLFVKTKLEMAGVINE